MDEAFSALDVLSAENLRGELLDLWLSRRMPTRAILLVTHSIEEAILMADRVIILQANPGRIVARYPVSLPHPRDRQSPAFVARVDEVYRILTGGVEARGWRRLRLAQEARETLTLPVASISAVTGLLELVSDRGGRDDLYRLGEDLLMEVDDLLPLTRAAQILGLAEVAFGDFVITERGRAFANADVEGRKEMFREQVRTLPPVQRIVSVLTAKSDHTMDEEFFLGILERDFSPEEARRQLQVAIDWGRYAELFSYDSDNRRLFLEEPEG